MVDTTAAEREEFLAGFKAGVASKLGGGGAIEANHIVVTNIADVTAADGTARRRHLSDSTPRTHRRKLAAAVAVDFHMQAVGNLIAAF